MKRFEAQQAYLVFLLILSVFLIAGCGGGDDGVAGNWLPRQPVSIEVTPPNQSIAKGTTQQFMATAIYADNSKKDLTLSVTWTSSNVGVATISNAAGSKGLATSVAIGGPITITATDPASGRAGTATLTVTAATLVSIGVTPVNRSIALGTNQQFIATGTYTDFTTQDLTSSVTWASSVPLFATISNAAGSNGLATSAGVGTTTITATDPTMPLVPPGTATLTVTAATLSSITVTPANRTVVRGINQQFIATGIYSDRTTLDLTSSVTWASSAPAVATISNGAGSKGFATSLAVGTTNITAVDPAWPLVPPGNATLNVTNPNLLSIGITPVNRTIALGINQQFIATGIYDVGPTQDLTSLVTWGSLVPAVATISNLPGSNGFATSAGVGATTITATLGGISGNTQLTVTAAKLVSIGVTPVNPSIANGTTQQFMATGLYTDGTTLDLTLLVTWTTFPLVSPVATISNVAGSKGLATSLAQGTTTIRATDPANPLVPPGNATLTVTPALLANIVVTPVNPSIALGTKLQFKATGKYGPDPDQDLTSLVTWESSVETVATISNLAGSKGLATASALIAGATTIRATVPGLPLMTDFTTLTVKPAAVTLDSITVDPLTAGIPVGETVQFTARGNYSDGSTQDLTSLVTWTTFPLVSPVATIDNAAGFEGLATALAPGGPIPIRATDPVTGRVGNATLTVTIAPNLGAAAPFGGFGGGAGMTNQGTFTVINGGDIGTTGVSTKMTGFHDSTGDSYTETPLNKGNVKDGRIYTAPPPPVIFLPGGPFGGTAETMVIATAAADDALTAFNYLAGLPPTGPDPSAAGELGGLNIPPGTYKAAGDTFRITTGDLTLTGTASDVWVFQMGTSLTVGAPAIPRTVHLAGGALAKNVFWQVGSAARIENGCTMVGTIISSAGVTISTAGEAAVTTLNGRALSLVASVTMVNTVINVPAP